jgi:hypothetical protein
MILILLFFRWNAVEVEECRWRDQRLLWWCLPEITARCSAGRGDLAGEVEDELLVKDHVMIL